LVLATAWYKLLALVVLGLFTLGVLFYLSREH